MSCVTWESCGKNREWFITRTFVEEKRSEVLKLFRWSFHGQLMKNLNFFQNKFYSFCEFFSFDRFRSHFCPWRGGDPKIFANCQSFFLNNHSELFILFVSSSFNSKDVEMSWFFHQKNHQLNETKSRVFLFRFPLFSCSLFSLRHSLKMQCFRCCRLPLQSVLFLV